MDVKAFWWILLGILVSTAVASFYGCDESAPQKAMRCVETLFPTAQQGGPMGYTLAWDYHKMRAACIDGTISLSVFCVKSIMTQCENDKDQTYVLKKYFDTDRMYNGLQLLCDQLEEARQYMPCMQSQLQGFMRCAEDKLGVFEERTKAAGADVDKLVAASCSFMNTVYGCQTTAVRRHCGEFPAKFIMNIMDGFRPPSCQISGASGSYTNGILGIKLLVLLALPSTMLSYIL